MSLSTTHGGDSDAETVVAAREAVVPTGWMAAEDKQLEDKKERQPKGKKEKQLDKEKPLEDERKQRLEEEQKLFMVEEKWFKEEKKKRNQDEEEEQWTNSRSMTPPPRYSRSSQNSTKFQGCQPGDAQPDPVLQGMVDCLTSISYQIWRMSEGSGKNGGWPRFNGTYKDYPAFQRKWNSYEKHHHQLTPQMELVQLF